MDVIQILIVKHHTSDTLLFFRMHSYKCRFDIFFIHTLLLYPLNEVIVFLRERRIYGEHR